MCVRDFTAGKTYDNYFFSGVFRVTSISASESCELGLHMGSEIVMKGHFAYIYRGSLYRAEIVEDKPYKGKPRWEAVSISEAPRTCSDMKMCIMRSGTNIVTSDDIDAIWNEFGLHWYDALTARPGTKRHARLEKILGGDHVAKMAVLVEHFYDSSWIIRLRKAFPSMSEGTAKKLAKVLESCATSPVDGYNEPVDLFQKWANYPWSMSVHVSGLVGWRNIDRVALLDADLSPDDDVRLEYAMRAYVVYKMDGVHTCMSLYDFRGHEVYQDFLEYTNVAKHVSFSGPVQRFMPDGTFVWDESPTSALFTRVLKNAISFGILHKDVVNRIPYVTDMKSFDNEDSIARRLAFSQPVSDFDEDTAIDILDEYCSAYDRNLDFSQREAVLAALGNRTSFICGRPGYGKSSIIDAIMYASRRQIDAANPERVQVCILTVSGMAGQRVRDENVVGPNSDSKARHPGYLDFEVMTIAKALRYPERIRESAVVLIDEASMCSSSDIGNICNLVSVRSQMIFVGDDAQLAPIGAGSPFSDIIVASSNTAFPFPVVTLAVNHRLGNAIGAEGLSDAFDAVRMQDVAVWDKRVEDESIRLLDSDVADANLANAIVDRYMERLERCHGNMSDVVVLTPKHGSYVGRVLLSMLIRERVCPLSDTKIDFDDIARSSFVCNERGVELCASGFKNDDKTLHDMGKGTFAAARALGLPLAKNHNASNGTDPISPKSFCVGFRIGDRVLCNTNDFDVYNGDVGTILDFRVGAGDSFYQGIVTIELDRGPSIMVPLSKLCTSFDLGYALTVHKSQGSEFTDVVFCVERPAYVTENDDFLTNKLLYTALTRTKRRVDVFSVKGAARALVEKVAPARNTLLVQRIKDFT